MRLGGEINRTGVKKIMALPFEFVIEDCFSLPEGNIVVVGQSLRGEARVGDTVQIVRGSDRVRGKVLGIHRPGMIPLDVAIPDPGVIGITLEGIGGEGIRRGEHLESPNHAEHEGQNE